MGKHVNYDVGSVIVAHRITDTANNLQTVITVVKFQKAFPYSYILIPRRGVCRASILSSLKL